MLVVWIYGVPGVGKSTTAWLLYGDLADTGVATAYVDIDQLGMCYPARDSDPDRHRLKGRALAALASNYAAAGAEVLIVSGVADPGLFDWYAHELDPVGLTALRVTVKGDELRRRLDERGALADEWEEVRREGRHIDAARLPHAVLDATGRTPRQVADAVRDHLGDLIRDGPADGPAPHPSTDGLAQTCLAPGRALWVCGPAGVGKSTVAWAVFTALNQEGTITGYLDLQQLGFMGGGAAGRDHSLQAANAASMWCAFHAAGATHLVLSGAVDSVERVHIYREALPAADLTLCRLRADRTTLARRIHARGRGAGPRLAGDRLADQPRDVLEQAIAASVLEQEQLESLAIGDVVLDTTAVTASEVATQLVPTNP